MTIKLAAIAFAALVLLSVGYYVGTLRSKTAYEGLQAAQSELTAKAVLAERAAGAAELARVNLILKGYQDAPPDPIAVGLAHRVYVYASAASCTVPSASRDPRAPVSAPAQPGGDAEAQRLLQAVFDACSADARELSALQAAWPR